MKQPDRYIIIGGSTKCGTTSVFKYLEFHPGICPATMKESRYFLDRQYALHAAGRDHSKTTTFGMLFHGCKPGQAGLEATPDYLYSANAADEILRELRDVKMVFILREPTDRLISWYRFARMNGLLPGRMSFDQYVELQKNQSGPDIPQHLKAMEQGNYYAYLSQYLEAFGREKVMVCFYEDLKSSPADFCKAICKFAGISADYFEGYDFRVFNRTADTKSTWLHRRFRKFKRTVRPATRMLPDNLRKRLKLAGHSLEESVVKLNSTEMPVHPGASTSEFLSAYYAPGIQQLQEHYPIPASWRRNSP